MIRIGRESFPNMEKAERNLRTCPSLSNLSGESCPLISRPSVLLQQSPGSGCDVHVKLLLPDDGGRHGGQQGGRGLAGEQQGVTGRSLGIEGWT